MRNNPSRTRAKIAPLVIGAAAAAALTGLTVQAQELMVYPTKDQSQEQQDQDNFACYKWAKEQSGFDPMAPPTATAPPPRQEQQRVGVLGGALRGAVIGGIIDGGDGAAKGAAVGGVIGGVRRSDQNRRQTQERQNWEQEQARQYAENRNRYNRAFAACMEGRGYTVR